MSTTGFGDETVRLAQLDRHFALPRIRVVPTSEPLVWLRLGWRDLRANWTLSVGYGVLFALAGVVILLLAAPRPYLFTAVVSGFMLVAPLLTLACMKSVGMAGG
jgi:uncharacterized membrane protein